MPQKSIAELRDLEGTTRPSVEDFRVERGKIAEFAHAIGDANPIYHDPAVAAERGYDAVPAPPTFPRTAMFPRHRPSGYHDDHNFDLGFERGSRLHGGQEYEYDRPVVAGDVLSGETTLKDVKQRDGDRGTMTFADFETVYYDRSGSRVLTERLTRIEVEDEIVGEAESPPTVERPAQAGGAYGPDRVGEFDGDYPVDPRDVSVDATGPVRTVEDLTLADFVRYAGASGDFNRMHYDREYASSMGSPALFAPGMLAAGFASATLTTWFELSSLERFSVRFLKPVWIGDSLTVCPVVEAVDSDEQATALSIAIGVTNQDDTTVADGRAMVTAEHTGTS